MSNIHQTEDLKALGEKAWKGVKVWKGEKALVGREVEFHSYKEGQSVMEFQETECGVMEWECGEMELECEMEVMEKGGKVGFHSQKKEGYVMESKEQECSFHRVMEEFLHVKHEQ